MWIGTTALIDRFRATWKRHDSDAGYASEAVLVTALLIIGALVVIGILVAKVTSKAQEIDLGFSFDVGLGLLMTVAP